jgi:hypothetical protein
MKREVVDRRRVRKGDRDLRGRILRVGCTQRPRGERERDSQTESLAHLHRCFLSYMMLLFFFLGAPVTDAATDDVGVCPFCQKMYEANRSNAFANASLSKAEATGLLLGHRDFLCAASRMLHALSNLIKGQLG